MILVDSSGWLGYFKGGPLADAYEPYLQAPGLVVPTIVLYEVYKVLCRDLSEDEALLGAARLKAAEVVPLDDSVAMAAADISLHHGLAMADAIVYATAQAHDALLVTSDQHFAELPGVKYIPKDGTAPSAPP